MGNSLVGDCLPGAPPRRALTSPGGTPLESEASRRSAPSPAPALRVPARFERKHACRYPRRRMTVSPPARAIPDSLADLVGNTPMVRLTRVAPDCGAELIGKLESHNPGGSVKDRIG